jgi:rare lipoprotein A
MALRCARIVRASIVRGCIVVVLALTLAACQRDRVKPSRPQHAPPARTTSSTPPRPHPPPAPGDAPDGGPAIPPDVSRVPEPVPRHEPLARYGNKSPYTVLGHTYSVMPSSRGYVKRGTASWYGTKFHGRLTSSREPYDMYQMTAAHKTLPLPTFVRVTNLDNGRSIVVRVNDRGPFHGDRIIDLSYAAAVKLGIHLRGTGRVEVRALDPAHPGPVPQPLAPITAREREAPRVVESAMPRKPDPVIVQVGAFAERDNARALAHRLRKGGIDAVDVDRARSGGRTVHRVRVGPVPAGAVDGLRERLRRLGVSSISVATD